MKLITKAQRETMLKTAPGRHDVPPAVKLFDPAGAATWLLTALDPEDPDIAYGLCDLGLGYPETGSVRISELEAIRRPFGPLDRARPPLRAEASPVGLRRRRPERAAHRRERARARRRRRRRASARRLRSPP